MRAVFVCIAGFVILVAALRFLAPDSKPANIELVLPEQSRLTIGTDADSITITSGRGLERRYAWGRCELKTKLIARTARWYGSLGGYNPAYGLDPAILFSFACDGVSRPVVGEGQIHFETVEAAETWIRRYNSPYMPAVWSDDGLLARWSRTPARDQLNVDLWQICISGHRPAALKGSRNADFLHRTLGGEPAASLPCSTVGTDVVSETAKVWRDHWQQADTWRRADEQRERTQQISR